MKVKPMSIVFGNDELGKVNEGMAMTDCLVCQRTGRQFLITRWGPTVDVEGVLRVSMSAVVSVPAEDAADGQ